jgi:predicted ATP-grasp superfamily ATP-dependent carboligase
MPKILVLDGHSPAALAFTRSLGRAGYWVAVGSNRGIFAPASLSKYCRAKLEYPISTDEAREFAHAVLQFVQANQIELVVPITDWTTVPISCHRELFESVCKLALPSHGALELASDKYATIELARSLNVPVPETYLVRDSGDLDALPAFAYPVVVKDRSSARWFGNRAVFGSVSYAYSRDDLFRRVKQRLGEAGDVLIQKFAAGAGVGFSCFALNGEIYLPFQWLRIREVDPRGSGSCLRRSMPLDPDLLEHSRQLITKAGFQGLAMVEYKRSREDHRPILMEINGRPWGSIQLAIASGIDYPRYLIEWCLENKLPPSRIEYNQRITCRRMVGELGHLQNVRRGKPHGWPLKYPNFWLSAAKIAMPWYPGMRYDDLSLDDPRPGWAGIKNWFGVRLRNLARKKS